MLTEEWISPRNVDWTDSMNPLTGRGWGPDPSRNPFMFGTLSDPIWLALRGAENLEPRNWVVPDPIDEIIPAGGTYDMNVPIEPDTWLCGVNTWLSPTDGPPGNFYVQITDAVTGAIIFSQQVHASNLQAASGNTGSANGLVAWLSAPRPFLPPSYPIVRIVNLSNAPLKCNVNLWCAVEIPY
jgi:hypothetical protein